MLGRGLTHALQLEWEAHCVLQPAQKAAGSEGSFHSFEN